MALMVLQCITLYCTIYCKGDGRASCFWLEGQAILELFWYFSRSTLAASTELPTYSIKIILIIILIITLIVTLIITVQYSRCRSTAVY